MKLRSFQFITTCTALVALTALPACRSGKDNLFILFLPFMFGSNPGTVVDTSDGESTPSETSSIEIDGLQVILPDEVTQSATPEGDFNGLTYQANSGDVAGFFSLVDASVSNAAELTAMILSALNQETQLQTVNLVSSQPATNGLFDTQLLQITVTTVAPTTATGLSNILILTIGTKTGGAITALPSATGDENETNEFRILLQISHDATGGTNIVGVGVSTADNYAAAEALLSSLLDGSNTAPTGYLQMTGTSTFAGAAQAKADFLWVVDNSGSMTEEQSSVATNAENFFDRMTLTGLDFRIGVITTDSSTLKNGGFTNDKSTFQSNVTGLGGSGIESGIYFAERALLGGGSVAAAGYPRSGATLTVIILSDEGDHYACYTGGSRISGATPCTGGTAFNFTDNVFLQSDVSVYSIIGLNASGEPGKCSSGVSGGPAAGDANNADQSYYRLAATTGGSSASICNTDYTPVLEAIAAKTAGKASEYVLSHTPVSSSLTVTVDGINVTRSAINGFTYDAAGNSIVFAGAAIPAPGATIEVNYTRFQ